MKAAIESLEGRTLFAGGGAGNALGGAALLARAAASEDAAVQATLALVQADGAALNAARELIRAESADDTRPALKDVVRGGAETLAADRDAIKAAKAAGDDGALEAAKDKLKADRRQIREDVAAAREALRDDTAEGRAAFREASASLRAHLKQLRADLRNAAQGTPGTTTTTTSATGDVATAGVVTGAAEGGVSANPAQPQIDELVGDVQAIADKSDVTPEQVQGVVDQVDEVVQGATMPDENLVRTLIDNFTAAVDDRDVTSGEREQLRADVRAVLESANISVDDIREIAEGVAEIVRASNLTWSDLLVVADGVKDVYAALVKANTAG